MVYLIEREVMWSHGFPLIELIQGWVNIPNIPIGVVTNLHSVLNLQFSITIYSLILWDPTTYRSWYLTAQLSDKKEQWKKCFKSNSLI